MAATLALRWVGWVGVITSMSPSEALASVTKSKLRRQGLDKVVNDKIEHQNVLAVHS